MEHKLVDNLLQLYNVDESAVHLHPKLLWYNYQEGLQEGSDFRKKGQKTIVGCINAVWLFSMHTCNLNPAWTKGEFLETRLG